MLCSGCSVTVQPVVAVDIDGTLGDYHGHFLDFAAAYLGLERTPAKYDGVQPFGKWFCQMLGTDMTLFRQIKLAYRQGGMKRTMAPEPGCTKLVSMLRLTGAEVWLTTTRPYLRLDNVDPDTRFWLGQHGIEFDGMLYDEDKYKILAEMIDPERVVAVLDDLGEQCAAAANEFGVGVPILKRNNYNKGVVSLYQSVASLDDALSIIKRRIESWRLHHDS